MNRPLFPTTLPSQSNIGRSVGLRTYQHPLVYETGEWPKDFTEVTTTAFKQKLKATNCRDHSLVSLIAHRAKVLAGTFSGRIPRKIEDVLGEDQFLFRKEKELGTRL
jgi:hypothetical protein